MIAPCHLPVLAHHLANTVQHDDGFVQRIADDRQDGGDGGGVEFQLGQREEADSEKQIVHRRDDRADRELPLEAEPKIAQYGDDGEDDAERA